MDRARLFLTLLFLGSLAAAQTKVVEIKQMTVPHSVIDMDLVGPAGPTTIGQVNAAGSGLGGSLADIVLTVNPAALGVYNTNPTLGRALGRTTQANATDLILVDPPAGAFGACDASLRFAHDCTEFGLSLADWAGAASLDFYSQGRLVLGAFATSTYSTAATKYFQMQGGTFDRVDVKVSAGGNWVIPELATQVPPVSYTPFGIGCPGKGGTPKLAPLPGVSPRIGAPFQAQVTGMPPAGGLAFMALGTSERTLAPVGGLPFDLAGLGAPGCRIWCTLTLLLPLPNIAGSGTFNLGIPNAPALIGARFYNQAYVPDAGANGLGLILSNAARGTVQ